MTGMTKQRFAKRLAFALSLAWLLIGIAVPPAATAQDAQPAPKAGKPINVGDVLSGELNAMRVRSGKDGKRVPMYQITSEPRRLPPPGGLCNLETGPETFQLIANGTAQTAQLKSMVGREISVKVDEIACAEDAGQMSEAVVSKWSVVRH
jgi:hypothetical protein